MTTIRHGVVIDVETYYPSGFMWLLAFARRGCQRAIDAIEDQEEMIRYQYEMSGYPNIKQFVLIEKGV